MVILVRIGTHGSGWNGKEDLPETIAGEVGLLAGSMLVEMCRGLGMGERDALIKNWGERYRIGSVRGPDGVVRLGVDFEEGVEREERLEFESGWTNSGVILAGYF
jgi:hypothetical protein